MDKTNDRGGLKHVSLDTFNCFKAIELVTYRLISEGRAKDNIISQTFDDPNIVFHWDLISEIPEEAVFRAVKGSHQLMVYDQWIFCCQ